jgi:hypothetical protein
MTRRGSLALLADRHWLFATDDYAVEGIEPEALYKLGFLNALQIIALSRGQDPEVNRALRTAERLARR